MTDKTAALGMSMRGKKLPKLTTRNGKLFMGRYALGEVFDIQITRPVRELYSDSKFPVIVAASEVVLTLRVRPDAKRKRK